MDRAFKDSMERDRLHFAAGNGKVREVKRLISEGMPVNAFDELGKTPLHYAIMRGHLQVAKVLLEAGADVNAADESQAGNTPLGEVAGECTLEVANFLLQHGADPTIPGWMQITPLHRAEGRKRGDGPAVVRAMWEVIKAKKRH